MDMHGADPASLWWQYALIALAVLVSAAVVVRKRLPGVERAVRGRLALLLVRPGRAAWLQRLGRAIAPPAAGSGGACGGCDSCGPGKSPRQH